ncbi:aminoacyl-tRNA hydrolase [Caldinitratiruptor microaerophilus]|uniref:Peptidyl-tRNA hydrolase n=1 Tax=Caldinitratiruptor microaerophilus TaxID=671077 RepID=A0AA35CMP2_9FIRM|nr:aminoacyl-tRNA hydrolase [Caldinitratiruptor microaerophilus]BDG62012.1 peptidyl-tRNA hydrolase [Caldinitratiruptor microaerophilus]
MTPWIVAGLGNPGPRYARTRHNVGFWVVDRIAGDKGLGPFRSGHQALYVEWRVGQERAVLLKPQTFMNLSGEAVAAALRWYKADAEHLIVIYDDIDLKPGRLRLREQGSSGGHRGVQSVIEAVGTSRFRRIRIGVGRPAPGWDAADWVLAPFDPDDEARVLEAVARAAEALEVAIRLGFTTAMNRFNGIA